MIIFFNLLLAGLFADSDLGDRCTKVYSQVKESHAFDNCGKSISDDCYVKDGDNFIDFRGWENQKEYNFELRYASSSDNAVVTWTQTENPFSIYDTKATVTNFSLTLNGENYTYENDNVFAGLSVSSSSYTLLDGNVVNGWWWYSVGNNKAHLASANKVNGNPGVIPYSATLSELYICQPKETANTSTTTATITTATITPETDPLIYHGESHLAYLTTSDGRTGFPANKMFDNLAGNSFSSVFSSYKGWIEIEFSSPVVFKDVELVAYNPIGTHGSSMAKQYGDICFSIDDIETGCTHPTFIPSTAQLESNLENPITFKDFSTSKTSNINENRTGKKIRIYIARSAYLFVAELHLKYIPESWFSCKNSSSMFGDVSYSTSNDRYGSYSSTNMQTITMANNIDRQCAEKCWNTAGCYRFFITGEQCNFVIGYAINYGTSGYVTSSGTLDNNCLVATKSQLPFKNTFTRVSNFYCIFVTTRTADGLIRYLLARNNVGSAKIGSWNFVQNDGISTSSLVELNKYNPGATEVVSDLTLIWFRVTTFLRLSTSQTRTDDSPFTLLDDLDKSIINSLQSELILPEDTVVDETSGTETVTSQLSSDGEVEATCETDGCTCVNYLIQEDDGSCSAPVTTASPPITPAPITCRRTKDCPRNEMCRYNRYNNRDSTCECSEGYERVGAECVEIYSLLEEIAGVDMLDQLDHEVNNCIGDFLNTNNINKLNSLTNKFSFFHRSTRKFLKKYHHIKFVVEKRKEKSGDACECIGDATDAYANFFDTLDIDMSQYNVQNKIATQGAKVKIILNKRGNCSL